MSINPEILKAIRKASEGVVLPWEMTANIPFYVDVKKPRPSLSKHDSKKPTFWSMEDATYMLYCVNAMPDILKHIDELEADLADAWQQVDGG